LLLGPCLLLLSFGMKTSAHRILQAALTDLNKRGLNNEFATKVREMQGQGGLLGAWTRVHEVACWYTTLTVPGV
jgi:hypothetical protein